jgi:hypothetical protein
MLRHKAVFGALLVAFGLTVAAPALAQSSTDTRTTAQHRRTHITVYPQRSYEPGPNAKRLCRSWLAQEYRVSGPVIVPRMTCWWE